MIYPKRYNDRFFNEQIPWAHPECWIKLYFDPLTLSPTIPFLDHVCNEVSQYLHLTWAKNVEVRLEEGW